MPEEVAELRALKTFHTPFSRVNIVASELAQTAAANVTALATLACAEAAQTDFGKYPKPEVTEYALVLEQPTQDFSRRETTVLPAADKGTIVLLPGVSLADLDIKTCNFSAEALQEKILKRAMERRKTDPDASLPMGAPTPPEPPEDIQKRLRAETKQAAVTVSERSWLAQRVAKSALRHYARITSGAERVVAMAVLAEQSGPSAMWIEKAIIYAGLAARKVIAPLKSLERALTRPEDAVSKSLHTDPVSYIPAAELVQ